MQISKPGKRRNVILQLLYTLTSANGAVCICVRGFIAINYYSYFERHAVNIKKYSWLHSLLWLSTNNDGVKTKTKSNFQYYHKQIGVHKLACLIIHTIEATRRQGKVSDAIRRHHLVGCVIAG